MRGIYRAPVDSLHEGLEMQSVYIFVDASIKMLLGSRVTVIWDAMKLTWRHHILLSE